MNLSQTGSVYFLARLYAGEEVTLIYRTLLVQSRLDDVTLQSLIGDIPPKSLLLMEDIDCAFGSREAPSADAVKEDSRGDGPRPAQPSSASRVTFSGLCKPSEGVGYAIGR
jgi:chaperone BCS1